MRHRQMLRPFGYVFAATVLFVTVFFVQGSSAAAVYTVRSTTTAVCDKTGETVPAGHQLGFVGSELHGFWDSEPIRVTFEFPDGRIFSPDATFLLDGVVDLPPNYRTEYLADVAGDLYFEFPISNKWPYGCYTLSARGVRSGQSVASDFVVTPRVGAAPNSGLTKFAVMRNGTFDSSGAHNSTVNLHGLNFMPNEVISVWITQPDGTVIDYPQQVASDIGAFQSSFVFTEAHQTGRYMFTALGTTSGYQIFAPFDLESRSSTPTGFAQFRVMFPAPASTSQNDDISVAGSLFSPNEPVGIWMTMPNNAVRGLPTQQADGNGDFFATIDLDERLPVGTYRVTAKGVNSGRLVIQSFEVTSGRFEGVDPDKTPAQIPNTPHIVDSNTAGTSGGPTNLNGAQSNPGPERTPRDTQDCNRNQLWTENC
jgi:hypothetical protein